MESNINPDDDGIPLLPEQVPECGEEKTLSVALTSPDKSTVVGKIAQVSPIKYRREGTLAVKAFILKDKKTTAKVCLFRKNAEMSIKEGDMVEITAVYPKKYLNNVQLTVSPASKCQFIADDPSIEIKEEDHLIANSDPDFSENLEEEQKTHEVTIIDFTCVDLYACCEVKGKSSTIQLWTFDKMNTVFYEPDK